MLSRIALQTIVLFLSEYFVSTLAERLRDNELRLEHLVDCATAEQQLLEQSLATTGSALRVLNRDCRIFWANPQWRDWFDELATLDERVVAALDGAASPAARTFRDGETRITELVFGNGFDSADFAISEGHSRVFQITAAPLADPDDRIQRIVELAQDITEQKRVQAQMVRAGKLAAVGELAGQVAHEVNNPIAIITAKLQLLLSLHRNNMSEKIAEKLVKCTEQADRVVSIAQRLLSHCRFSSATRSHLDLRQLPAKSLALIKHHARKAGVTIRNDLAEHLLAVEANAGELKQVSLNRFVNALDAMPQGSTLAVTPQKASCRTADPQWRCGCATPAAESHLKFEIAFSNSSSRPRVKAATQA